jgi:hypothetical protein
MAITTVHPLFTEWYTVNGESMATYGTWNIWVCDANPTTGVIPASEEAKRAQFNENMDYVNRILNCLTPNGLNNGALAVQKHYLSTVGAPVDTVLTTYAEVSSSYSYEDAKQFNCAMLSVEISYRHQWRRNNFLYSKYKHRKCPDYFNDDNYYSK